MDKVDRILLHARREGVINAKDSNVRSTSWHDTTNSREHLEDYIISKGRHTMNEPSPKSTFGNEIDKSNIYLTLVTRTSKNMLIQKHRKAFAKYKKMDKLTT